MKKMLIDHLYLATILLIFISFQTSISSGKKPNGLCVSQGGRFPPFENEGKPPKKVTTKGAKDLHLCRVFRKKTCCSYVQTHPAFVAVRKLASTGEGSEECLHLFELLECSICDPHTGVQPGPPRICASFCERVFQACSSAYFSMDGKTRVLAPCGVNDFVCGTASEWVSNGTEFCRAAGFVVETNLRSEETSCYGGKASLDSVVESWSTPKTEVAYNSQALAALEDFKQWLQEIALTGKVSWAVGGMVLTAGLLFLSKRKSRSYQEKLEGIQQSARRLDGKMEGTSSFNQGIRNRK